MGLGAQLGGVMGGILNSGRGQNTIDLSALFDTISKNKDANQLLITDLPKELQPLYQAYQDSLKNAGTTLKSDTTDVGNKLLSSTQALYGPDSDAVKATLAALRQSDYSTLPGTVDSLKANLAATGGLSRGGSSKAITQAVLNPAAQFSQQSANVMGQQLTTQQTQMQSALNKIASMDDNVVQQIFGMSKEEAANILQYGRSDLQQQLTQLVNNNNAATQANLSLQGIQANNAYQNANTHDAQQAAIVNGLTTGVGQGIEDYFTGGLGELSNMGGGSKGFDPNTQSTAPNGSQQYRPISSIPVNANNGMFAIA